jgi:DNA-binding NtrC family response regulator
VIDFEHLAGYSCHMKRRATILVVDDDADVLTAARLLLQQHFTKVLTSSSPDEVSPVMDAERIDVFLVDMNFAIGRNSGEEGLKCLELILKKDSDAVVVLMTAFGDLNTAVSAMREGAADFVLKPWQNDKLVATLNVAAALRESRATVTALSEPTTGSDMIVGSTAMKDILKVVARVAPTEANVLIRGENGTGKELIAQAIHRQSSRSEKVLMTVDLGSVAESLFESELFGHKKGAFTGADSDRAGRFHAANGGTLFLDEVGNLPASSQSKLLRVLESREVATLGSDQSVPIDVRLITATNRSLESMVADGEFREDLLYRINTIEILLPPLRDRLDDIPVLANHFASVFARKYRLPEKRISAGGHNALASHHWPGNVRELSHTVERAVILSDDVTLDAEVFSLTPAVTGKAGSSLNLESNEKSTVKLAIEKSDGNISHAANALGITRAALYRRIEKFRL